MSENRYRQTTYQKRFLAWLVDTAFLAVYMGILIGLTIWLKTGWLAVIAMTLFALIKVYFWTMSTTLGKLVLGLKIVHRSTEKDLSLLEMAGRQTLGKFLSIMFLYMGIIWILIDPNNQGWHDIMADSMVVEMPKKIMKTMN